MRQDSNQDGGTLMQLKNLINRKNVPSKPKADMNACEDFLDLVMTSHILAAGMDLLQMTSLEDDPHSPYSHLICITKLIQEERNSDQSLQGCCNSVYQPGHTTGEISSQEVRLLC